MFAFLGLPSASSIAKAILEEAVRVVTSLLATGVQDLLDALFGFINSTTDPVFTSPWWQGPGIALLVGKVLPAVRMIEVGSLLQPERLEQRCSLL